MKTYDEMFAAILAEAENDERIRAVTMEGSNSSPASVHDRFSDFDITFFVTDVREFTNDRSYMERFGEILIMQCPDDWYGQPYDYNSRENFAYLTQYRDGNRIDLTFVDVSHIAGQEHCSEPRKVLINKDCFSELKDSTDKSGFYIQKPSAKEYADTCNEFRWIANYATKGLCRDEFFYARQMMEHYMMDMFMKMINWRVGADHDFSVTTGACSKYLKRYLSEDEMLRFRAIFADGSYEDMWTKLFLMYDYFADLARYVAGKLDFFFDEEETAAVRAFMEERQAIWQT